MADWYIDHGCTLYPSVYMTVPTGAGSFPQEGDGKASGTGTAPAVAVATMDFTGATAAAGATFSVHGATLTGVASGASTVQFNVGSGATLASNLATAINAATASPTTTTGGISSPYLKALVWASASGAVLTVYTRIASADLNQSANASAILSCGVSNWTSAPANANFSGGVSGPWGLWHNTAALTAGINASISAIGAYGGSVTTMMGLPAAGDRINVRTGRAGADITVSVATTVALTVRTVGTISAYLEFLFDNGAIWNDGNSNGVFTIQRTNNNIAPSLTIGGYTRMRGQMKTGTSAASGGTVNFKFGNNFTESGGFTFKMITGSGASRHCIIEGMEMFDIGTGSALGGVTAIESPGVTIDPMRPALFRNCKFNVVRQNAYVWGSGTTFGLQIEAIDCVFAAGGATTYANLLTNTGATGASSIRLVRPKFTGGGGGHHKLFPAGTAVPNTLVVEDPIDMGQFIMSDSAASVLGNTIPTFAAGSADNGIGQYLIANSGRTFIIDTTRRLIEQRAASFPTTGISTFPDGAPYSVRFSVPHTGLATNMVTPLSPVRGIKSIAGNTLGAGTRSLTLHMLLDASYGGSSYTAIDSEWWIEVQYVSSVDGSIQTVTTQGTGSSLAADTQSWTSLTFSPFAGASRSYTRWKIDASLPNCAADCEVSCYLYCGKQPSTMNEWCFVDPEFELT